MTCLRLLVLHICSLAALRQMIRTDRKLADASMIGLGTKKSVDALLRRWNGTCTAFEKEDSMANESITSLSLGGTILNDENYADFAEQCILKGKQGEGAPFRGLTTTKLRSLYGLIMNVYTRINVREDFETHKSDLQYIKVKMAYEAGREKSVKVFLEKTKLLEAINEVKNYKQFLLYCRYAESLVAYFKFYGGEDK
ncbi:type III-A CRISPR-associated protein Csm2 [Eggerthellaceae bacterium zg-893]|nr:type III-A CRISPR-associated protein Csm2 [Eggerthellaceae bacterium zg-893]